MHQQARHFTLFIKQILSKYFINKRVLDVGSGDINGNNRFLFEGGDYVGNDVVEAPNVTIVSKTAALPFEDESFDTIVSTECFEHDPEYKASFLKIYAMLKPGGVNGARRARHPPHDPARIVRHHRRAERHVRLLQKPDVGRCG